MAAKKVIASTLACVGRIADPMVEASWGGGGAAAQSQGMLAGLAAWSRKKRTAAATGRALGELNYKWMKGEWNQPKFLEEVTGSYAALFAAVSAGALTKVRPLVTEQAFVLVKRGVAEGSAAHKARPGAEVVQTLGASTVAQCRLVHMKNMAMRNPDARPDAVQITVTHTTLQRPFTTPLSRDEARAVAAAAGVGSGYTSDGEAATAPRSASSLLGSDAESGEWVPVEHPGTGLVYWFNTATGVRTWTTPLPAQLVPRRPFRFETAGVLRGHITDAAAAAAATLPFMKVVHNVVWERNLEGIARWRVAKL